jgi:hypothetical protein
VPPGKPLSLPPDVPAAIAQAPQHPTGFAPYEALRQWVQQTSHRDGADHPLDPIVRARRKSTLNAARPSHTKHPRSYPCVSGDVSGASAAGHPA